MKWWSFWRREPHSGVAQGAGGDPDGGSDLLTGDPIADNRSIEVLLDSIAEVSSSIDLDRVLQDIVAKSLEVSGAERGLLLLGSDPATLRVRVAQDQSGKALGGDVVYSKTLVARCLSEGTAERSVVQSDQEALELGQSVFDLKLRAVMCAPLQARDKTVGVIYVDSTAVRREFSGRDLALFGALSAQLASAIETARLHEDSIEKVRLQKDVEIANKIQQHLLGTVPKEYPSLDLAIRFTARSEASGDTYDFVPMSDGRLVALVGDVTGHGVGAALLTHAAQAAVRSYLELIDDLSEVMQRLNERLVRGVEPGNFMSMIMVLIDPTKRTVQYVNAGHPGLMRCRKGKVTIFEKTGMVLGVDEDQKYPASDPIDLEEGDLLFMRTDGVDEARGPGDSLFGEEQLGKSLGAACGNGAEKTLSMVEGDIATFAQGVETDDDVTMVAIRFDPSSTGGVS
ncbi:MAG: GAF domain-containing SpoIIE family protein phosphatase [Planctomycetota bacterium]